MNDLTKEQLEELVQSLAWNDGYGCYTRAGFEKIIWKYIESKARWIIFFDIDNMHDLNDRHGYAGVNAIIKKSLAMRETDFMAGQWFSGDEFIVCITDDDPLRDISNPVEFCMRLAKIFQENGAPSTFAIAPVRSSDLFANVAPALELIQDAKRENNRGSISIVPGDPR